MVMTDEQAESRITVDQPGGRDAFRRGPAGWLLPLIGMLVLGAIWSFRGEVTQDAGPADDLEAVELVTTTTTLALEGDLSSGWIAIDLPGEGAIVEILSSRFGLFAVGTDGDQASLWRSSDGIIWDLVGTENGAFAGSEINALVETESGLVAVGAWTDTTAREPEADRVYGRERRLPAVWLSVDGETWERIPDDLIGRSAGDNSPTLEARRLGSMNDVVVWEGQLVAVGWSSSADHQGAAWFADLDGRSWKPATRGLAGSGKAFTEVSSISVVDRGLVAVGSILSRPSVWLSHDSMTWSVAYPDALGTQRHDRPVEVTAGTAGLVAIGAHQQLTGNFVEPARAYSVIWLSRDGEDWLRLEPEELAGVVLEDVIAEDPWLLAVGAHAVGMSERPGVWYSATGAEWKAIDLGTEDHQWGDSKVHAIVRGGPGLVAGGTLEGRPEVWLWSPHGPVAMKESVWVRPATGRWAFRSALDQGFPTWSIGETPGGYVAAYRDSVRTSLDGLAWETLPIEEAGLVADRNYQAPVTINETAYLVNENGSIWSSPDGRFWTLLADSFSGWLEGPRPGRNDELLLLEHPRYHFGEEEDQFRIWKSVDGVNWSEVPLPAVEFIQNVGVVGDRYILFGWSSGGRPSLWASTQDGGWDPVELSAEFESLEIAEVNGRLLMAVSDGRGPEGEEGTTRILTTSDGVRWGMSDMEFAGWPIEIGGWDDSRVFMILDSTTEPGRLNPKFTMWSSVDGLEWTQLGALPAFADSWPRILSTRSALRIVIESEQNHGIWEWVPPAG